MARVSRPLIALAWVVAVCLLLVTAKVQRWKRWARSDERRRDAASTLLMYQEQDQGTARISAEVLWPNSQFEHKIVWSHEPGRAWLGSAGQTSGQLKLAEGDGEHEVPWRVVSHTKPRALVIDAFLRPGEAEAIIELAQGRLARSKVVSQGASGKTSQSRTSQGTFLASSHPVLRRVRNRVSQAAMIPLENIEPTQVLRYMPGEQYKMHPDFFSGKKKQQLGEKGQRVATMIAWMNEVAAGGETRFNADPPVVVKPNKSSAILFYSVDENGKEDPTSMHAAHPPEGNATKWVAVFWLRRGAYRR